MDKELATVGAILSVLGAYLAVFGGIYYYHIGTLRYVVVFSPTTPFWEYSVAGAQVVKNLAVDYFGVALVIAGIYLLLRGIRSSGH